MKKILSVGLVLAALLIATAAPAAAADTTTATIVKAWVIGPGGNLLTIGSQGSGEITVAPGDNLIIMGQAKKDGKDTLTFNLTDTSAEPQQTVVTKLFQTKAKKQAKVIQYKFTPDVDGTRIFRFNITNQSGTELDSAQITIQVVTP